MRVSYHRQAEAEVVAAAQYYAARQSGLGAEFLDEVDACVDSIRPDPARFPVFQADVHFAMLNRFPYSVFFRIGDDSIRILTVRHHHRHPDYGLARQ
jgi:toxin ParE1/3/4